MPHVITQSCCNDASCVPVCPVGCIHPDPSEPGFGTTEMLYIDPATCIDCGVCVSACPVDAIVPERLLAGSNTRYQEINARYYEHNPIRQSLGPVALPSQPMPVTAETLRVAIIGSGPAGCYAAAALLEHPNIEVSMFDRLPTPWGLVRAGVAPDHPHTKEVTTLFERVAADGRFHFYLNVEIGRDLSHAEVMAHHHAVIYAHGASGSRRLNIPGEDLPGSCGASEFVNWYNGHPDFADRVFDLSGTRAVIIGNGNVALDVARALVVDPDVLASTDMADYAVETLRHSNIEEVVVLGRRGPSQAAYTSPELLALGDLDGVDVVIAQRDAVLDSVSQEQIDSPGAPPSIRTKTEIAAEFAGRGTTPGNRRIVLAFYESPVAILGGDRVSGVLVARNRLVSAPDGAVFAEPTGEQRIIGAGLVLRSVGYQGQPVPGLPFDARRGVLANQAGRVVTPDTQGIVTGVYTAGWIKRGPTGVIGTNKTCARDTVANLVQDFAARRLAAPVSTRAALAELVRDRQPDAVDNAGWRAIDAAEREAGRKRDKQRHKLTRIEDLLAATAGSSSTAPTAPDTEFSSS